MAISHAGHNHPATAAARKACRNSTGNPRVDRIEADGFNVNAPRKPKNWTAGSVRRAGVAVGKARDLRAKAAGVPVKGSCVQAALHTDAHGGRCACGWVAA